MALSTSSAINVDISVVVEEERNFYLLEGIPYEITVSPSESKYYYYKFTNKKHASAILEITSDDDVCLTVSIQDSYVNIFLKKKDLGKFFLVSCF